MKRILYIIILLSFTSCFKEKRSNNKALEMQNFVIALSDYARSLGSDFIVIPQNGIELVFTETDMESGLNMSYVDAIDGIGVEELFYDGSLAVDLERLEMLRVAEPYLKIMVADYITNNSNYSDVVQRNMEESFIAFPREQNNYGYQYIPDSIISENTNDINTLSEAQNYLYLIDPSLYSSKQDYLNSLAATNYDVLLIDMDYQEVALTAAEVNSLKTKANGADRLVISYINVGAAENWRYYWEDNWKLHRPLWLKKPYDGYEDEIWVKFWKDDWKNIIYGNDESYIKRIINAGFDGAYLDNVEAYYFLYFD
jgi:cysteinyl-tRNA synthetase, unknown class